MRPDIHIANLPVTVSSDLLNVLWFHMGEHQQALNEVSGITYFGCSILEVSPAPGIVGQMFVIPFQII